MNKENDVEVVAINNQQLYESPKISTQFALDTYRSFSDYLNSKYVDEENKNLNKQKELDYVFSIGIDKAKKEWEFERYPILFEGKPPRKDVMNKLVRIAEEFKSYPGYPIIKSMSVTNIINKIIDAKDKRTRGKYHKCIQTYIGKPKELGNTDASGFVDRIPNEFLNTTTSSSSFEENQDATL